MRGPARPDARDRGPAGAGAQPRRWNWNRCASEFVSRLWNIWPPVSKGIVSAFPLCLAMNAWLVALNLMKNCWLGPNWQPQSWTSAPSAFDAPATSRQKPRLLAGCTLYSGVPPGVALVWSMYHS
jgi:hypothetical protein